MGAIWFRHTELISAVSEIVGYKSGLALTRDELKDHAPDCSRELWERDSNEQGVRIRSEDFEDLVLNILYRLGAVASPERPLPALAVLNEFGHDDESATLLNTIVAEWDEYFDREAPRLDATSQKLDPTPFLARVHEEYGDLAVRMANCLIREIQNALECHPWSAFQRTEWQDQAELRELFRSESLETMHGTFIDQRFVDYLAQNFDSIDQINWRKFEGLAAEFFSRQGFHVEPGPGRNDNGIDIRVWPTNEDTEGPPALLVQCKRTKTAVGKVVVKALWADVIHEDATSGLIVTSSRLAPGAEKLCVARSYPIEQADRSALREWVAQMRTPNTGLFLAE